MTGKQNCTLKEVLPCIKIPHLTHNHSHCSSKKVFSEQISSLHFFPLLRAQQMRCDLKTGSLKQFSPGILWPVHEGSPPP